MPHGLWTLPDDPYEVLGVPPTADAAAIRAAYRRCAQATHPDLHPNDPTAAARFVACSAAYELLSDAQKRREYDARHRTARSGAPGPSAGRTQTASGARPGQRAYTSARPSEPPTDPIKRRIWELERELEDERLRDEIERSARERARTEQDLPEVVVTKEEAARGAEVLVTAGRRPVRLRVPPNTPDGQVFLLRDLGPDDASGQPTVLRVRIRHGVPSLGTLWDELAVVLRRPSRSIRELAVDALARAFAIYARFQREAKS